MGAPCRHSPQCTFCNVPVGSSRGPLGHSHSRVVLGMIKIFQGSWSPCHSAALEWPFTLRSARCHLDISGSTSLDTMPAPADSSSHEARSNCTYNAARIRSELNLHQDQNQGRFEEAVQPLRMSQFHFLPFVPCWAGDDRSLSLLTAAVTSVLHLKDALFADVLVSQNFRQFLDSFLRFSWRPHDQVSQTSRASTKWLQLRQQVLDLLSRALIVRGSNEGLVIHQLHLSAASAIDICALYAFDAQETCSSILRALLAEHSFKVALVAAITAAGSHLEQLVASLHLVRGDTAALHDILSCMEDIAASLVSTLTSAPQISRLLILNTDRPFLIALSNWHDTLLPQVGDLVQDAHRTLVPVLAGACAWLACKVLDHGVLKVIPPDRASATASAGSAKVAVSDELLPLLMDLKSALDPKLQHSLLSKLSKYGLMKSVDQLMNDELLEADSDEYAYLSALLGGDVEHASAAQHSHAADHAESAMHALPHERPAVEPKGEACASEPDLTTQRSMVAEMSTIFPAHGADFLHACFQHMGWNLEAVTNALLSESLPHSLQSLKGRYVDTLSTARPAASAVALPNYGRSQLDLDAHKTKRDLVEKTLNLIRTQEGDGEEYNDEYDDSFDALAGHGRWDGEAEVESSIHKGGYHRDVGIVQAETDRTGFQGSGIAGRRDRGRGRFGGKASGRGSRLPRDVSRHRDTHSNR